MPSRHYCGIIDCIHDSALLAAYSHRVPTVSFRVGYFPADYRTARTVQDHSKATIFSRDDTSIL